MMSTLQFNVSILQILFLVQVVLIVLQHTSIEAAVINNCINSTSSTNSCSDITYEQVYNILAKSENSFNIESALYPAKKPSSVHVFVNVYGTNKTDTSIPDAKYTWSISCLYAAFPAEVLQVWSLWSIMVSRRTQTLNITISLSCCDVSQGKLKEHITGVLAALQDLAVSPSIRDPRLNSAECVIEGHNPEIMATGCSSRLIIILCFSCLFAVLSGPLLAFYVLHYRKKRPKTEKRTIDVLCVCLIIIFAALLIYKERTICKADYENFPMYIHAIYPVVAGVGIVVSILTRCCCKVECKSIFYIACANLTAFHFCWLLVGIMLNPTWGLAALLIVCLVIGVFTYAVFTFLCSKNKRKKDTNGATGGSGNSEDKHSVQSFFSCLSAFLAVCCLLIVVILAGQSYHGREMADEVLKDGVLYLISVLFSWLYWKNCIASKNPADQTPNQQTSNGTSAASTDQTRNQQTRQPVTNGENIEMDPLLNS